jgi:cytochrome P450
MEIPGNLLNAHSGRKTEVKHGRIPHGPQEEYRATEDLLEWMGRQFGGFGDIYKASIYGCSAYVMRDVGFAHHVLVENWQNYVKGQIIDRVALLLGNGLMVSEGELWKRQRRMIQPAFNHESIVTLIKVIVAVNSGLLQKWRLAAQKNESVNVTHDVSGMALEVMLRFIFGQDYEEVSCHFDILFVEQTRDMAFARSFRALGKVILQIINRRRKDSAPATDALGIMMHARDPQSGQLMPDRQLIDETLTLIVAGHETTASTLNWSWYLISQHPEVEERLANELNALTTSFEFEDLPKFSYARQIIEEAMRLYPAGWLLSRKALGDDRLGDYFVPAGTELYLPVYFLQRHPDLWDEPDRFNPDRFQPENSKNRYRLATIPFSAGPRNCIGTHFARIEMQIHLMTIARYLQLQYVASRPVELDAGVNLRSKYDFIMYPKSVVASKAPSAG